MILSRRSLLKSSACGFGYLALKGLLAEEAKKDYRSPLAPRLPHGKARAKRVIFLFMQGGPSHVDTFDYKPKLQTAGESKRNRLLASPWKFDRHGQSGLPISELFPHLARHADDLCLLNGMHTDNPAHPQATVMLHTGSINFVRPSLGAWTVYGLGTENQDLPGFVTLNPLNRLGGAQNYGSAFLPATFQGTPLASRGSSNMEIPNLKNRDLSRQEQRQQLNFLQSLNQDFKDRSGDNSQLDAVIDSYELAYRMQAALPETLNLKSETEKTLKMYGIGERATQNFGVQCLIARRLAESGVRFIQLNHNGWDQHNNLQQRLSSNCSAIDQPIAGLIQDLKQRGLLDETLIVWGGEFGRTPAAQDSKMNGRRHNNRGYTMWMAGGGVKGGIRHGATDEIGDTAVQGKVHTHDLHATILHLLGLDHEKLTYRYAGRDFRLTDVYGDIVTDIVS